MLIRFLRLALAVVLLGVAGCAVPGSGDDCRNYLTADELGASFEDAMPVPEDLEPYYTYTDDATQQEVPVFLEHVQEYTWRPTEGVCIPKWGYEGTTPGPTIRVQSNQPSELMVLNEIAPRLYNPYLDPNNPLARVDPPSPIQTKYSFFGPDPNLPPAPYDRDPYARSMYELDPQATVHLHGGHQSPTYDGHPMDTFPPGRSHLYRYPNNQEATTLWYHDHDMDHTRGHVLMGLAGFYIVEDPEADAKLGLPTGDFDVPIMIQRVPAEMLDQPDSPNRPIWTANNTLTPHFEVENRPYRFRFLNGNDETPFRLWISETADKPDEVSPEAYLQLVGTDGGLLNQVYVDPANPAQTQVRLFPAERAATVVDFSKVTEPTTFYLQAAALPGFIGSGDFGPDPTDETPQPLIEFRVDPTNEDPPTFNPPGGVLRPDAPITMLDRNGATERTMEFDFENLGTPPFATINGQFFDEHRVDAQPQLGGTEVWTLTNPKTDGYHPIHIHDIFFQVIERKQRGLPVEMQPGDWGSGNLAWKDVFVVPPFGEVKIIGQFTKNLGTYVFHCHNLIHEDAGMMSQFEVVEAGAPVVAPPAPPIPPH